ncbi:hypothetical protein JX265_014008 [Neoarthrinium moseri]|uniref:Uncharacterized protein n=1 Tax=Neoarthrinium moseri TaxID=1658444 RepID=A0A9P9W7K5_9PEZI|nr:hypothetical protein JX265_014008 [Neoarthrinium moseri]
MSHLKAFCHRDGNQFYHQIRPFSSSGAYPSQLWYIDEFDTSEVQFDPESAFIPSISGKLHAFDDTLLPPQEERVDEERLEPIRPIFHQKPRPSPSPSAGVDGVCDLPCLGTTTDSREDCLCVLGDCAFVNTTLYDNAPSPMLIDSGDREDVSLVNWDETYFTIASDVTLSDFDISSPPAEQSPVQRTRKSRKAQKKRRGAIRQPKMRHGRNSRVRILGVQVGSGENVQRFQWRKGMWNVSNGGQRESLSDLMTPGAWPHLSVTVQVDGRSKPLDVSWCHETLMFHVVSTTTGEVAYLSGDRVQDMVEEVATGSTVHWDPLSLDQHV